MSDFNKQGYSFQPRGTSSSTSGRSATGVNAQLNLRGNYNTSTSPLDPSVNQSLQQGTAFQRTTAKLSKFLSAEGKKMAEKAQEEQFMMGMRRAQMGESLEEIKASDPFWKRWLGGSDAVRGAAVYTGKAAALTAQREIMLNADTLGSMSEGDREAYLIDVYNQLSPDDLEASISYSTDIMSMQSGLSNLLTGHIQKKDAETYSKNMGATIEQAGDYLDVVHQSYLRGEMTPDALTQEFYRYVSVMEKPPEIDSDTFYKVQTDSILNNARNGNFIAFKAFKETNYYSGLPQSYKDNLDKGIQSIARKEGMDLAINTYLPDIMDIQNLQASGASTQEIVERMEELNNRAKYEMGLPVSIYDSNALIGANSGTEQAIGASMRANRAAMTKAEEMELSAFEFKQQAVKGNGYWQAKDKELYDASFTSLMTNNGTKQLLGVIDTSSGQIDSNAVALLSSNYNNQKYVNPDTKRTLGNLSTVVKNGQYDPVIDTTYLPNFMAMVNSGNIAMATEYFGKDGFDFMMNYSQAKMRTGGLADGGEGSEILFNQAKGSIQSVVKLKDEQVTDIATEAINKGLTDIQSGWIWKEADINEDQRGQLQGIAENAVRNMPDSLKQSPEMASKYLATILDQSVFNQGEFMIYNSIFDNTKVGTARIDKLIESNEYPLGIEDKRQAIKNTILNRFKGAYGEDSSFFSGDLGVPKNIAIQFASTERSNEDGKYYLVINYLDTSETGTGMYKDISISIDDLKIESEKVYKDKIKEIQNPKPRKQMMYSNGMY